MQRTACRLCLTSARAAPVHAVSIAAVQASTSTLQPRVSASSKKPPFRQFHAGSRSRSSQSDAVYDESAMVPRLRTAGELYDISGKRGKRLLIKDPVTAQWIARIVTKEAMTMTVLDLYPGRGILSQALLNIPDVRAVVAAEQSQQYHTDLQKLLEESAGRFQYVTLDPFWWDAYSVMKERKYLSEVATLKWETKHKGLAVFAFVPNNINGERLIVQHLTCIPERMWLYDYGRFSSFYLVTGDFAKRLLAKAGETRRHKLAVMLEALVDIEVAIPSERLKPANKIFARHQGTSAVPATTQLVLLKFTPKENLLIKTQEELEVLEFLARNLFILKSRKWPNTLKFLAPGADIILKLVKEAGGTIDENKNAKQLTVEEWVMLVKAFLAWPFRPIDLEQSDLKDAAEFTDD